MCKQKVTVFLEVFLSDFHDFTPTSLANEYSKIQCGPDEYHEKQDNGLLLSCYLCLPTAFLEEFWKGQIHPEFPLGDIL